MQHAAISRAEQDEWLAELMQTYGDDILRLCYVILQDRALAEFYRVLKPGGYLLFAESTEAYIDTWVIRWLFRHPMHVQKSAAQYLEMIRDQGFEFDARNVSYPYLWWSRSKDFGLLERLGLRRPKPVGQREETLVNVVARKPLQGASA